MDETPDAPPNVSTEAERPKPLSHRIVLKIQCWRETLQKEYPQYYLVGALLIAAITIGIQHFYEKLLDEVAWAKVLSFAFYFGLLSVAALLFWLDLMRAKKNNIQFSFEPWILVIVLACFVGWPSGSWKKRLHCHLALLTANGVNGQNKWLHLTNPCMSGADKPDNWMPKGNGAVLAIPIYPGISSNGITFSIDKDSADDESPEAIELDWNSETPLVPTLNPQQPNGWGGNVPEDGFNNCVTFGIFAPGFKATALPPLQFKAHQQYFVDVKGMAKIRIRKRGYPDAVYAFGIQFVEDTNRSAYIIEEPIQALEAGGFDFVAPRRPQKK